MNEYRLSVGRETKGEFAAYPYHFEARIALPASDVWQQWIATLIDYDKTWLWPIQYSQPSVEAGLVERGRRVSMTYQIPNPYDSSRPPKNASHDFDILEFNDEEMLFEYGATDRHTFLQGGGAFQVKPVDDQTCTLIWSGEYRHELGDARTEAQGDAFAYYLCTFYTATAQNIRKATGPGGAEVRAKVA